jgi:arylformamidase
MIGGGEPVKIYDISPKLESGIPVWPGDESFELMSTRSLEQGDDVNLRRMTLSLHTGAHMDAPSHYLPGAASIEKVDLGRCMGPARVVTIEDRREIRPAELRSRLANMPPRLLVKSKTARDRSTFRKDFAYFGREAAEFLVGQGIILVGTDAPSVDRFEDESLAAHRAFGSAGVLILENLLLEEVPEGDYELIALPLRISNGEASPVRAILRDPEVTDR